MARRTANALARCLVHFGDIVPIDQVIDEGLEIVRSSVAVVYVVTVLPNIAAKDRPRAVDQRALAIGGFHDFDLADADGEPAPAGTELSDAGLDEILLHFRDRSEVGDDLLFQIAGHVAAAARLHPFPEVNVIVVLTGI